MDTLKKHKADNKTWSVNLWTDVTRQQLNTAAPDSDIGKFRQWAANNEINLVNIDEVFGQNTPMSQQIYFKLEHNKGGTGFAAASDILRLEALKRFGGIYTDGDDSVVVKFEDLTANVTPPKGVAAATVNASISNCVFCAQKDSQGVNQMLTRIGENYSLTRTDFLAKERLNGATYAAADANEKRKHGEINDAARSEIINRTGPRLPRHDLLQASNMENMIPADQIKVDTANTSWTRRTPLPCTPDVAAMQNIQRAAPLAQRKQDANDAAAAAFAAVPALPERMDLSAEELAKCRLALQKSLTTLAYQVHNESRIDAAPGTGGVLDLNYATHHLRGLPTDQQKLVMHAIVQTLGTDAFQGVRDKISEVKLPRQLQLPAATLDLMFDNTRFPNVSLAGAAVQDAALRGDMHILYYAQQRGALPDLEKNADVFIEAGQFRAVPGGEMLGRGGRMCLMEAAIKGGSSQAVEFLLNQAGAQNSIQAHPEWASMAAKFGQVQVMLDLVESGSSLQHVSALGEDRGAQPLVLLYNSLEANLAPGTADILNVRRAVFDHILNEVERIQPLQGAAIVGAQLPAYLCSDGDISMLEHLTQRGCNSGQVPAAKKEKLIENLVGLKDSERATAAVLAYIADDPVKNALLQEALKQNNAPLMAAVLKLQSPSQPHAYLLAKAETEIAIKLHPNREAIKDSHLGVNVADLSRTQALDLVHKAMAYTQSHLDNKQTGRAQRVAGWKQLMVEISQQFPADTRLSAAASEVKSQLDVLGNKRQTVGESLGRLSSRIASRLPGHQVGGGGPAL